MEPERDGGKLSNGMREKVWVLCDGRVALIEASGKVVDQHAKWMVCRVESLQSETLITNTLHSETSEMVLYITIQYNL